jgi:hypothetical protein
MKTMHDEQRELLEDIFTPEESARSISALEVMKLVEAECRARSLRRRGITVAAAAILGIVGVWLSMRTLPKPDAAPRVAERTAEAPTPAAVAGTAAITPPNVEHVDDEGMLALLGKQPTALVRWPDGRQSLLLLVATPPK